MYIIQKRLVLAFVKRRGVSSILILMDLLALVWYQTYTGKNKMTEHDFLKCTDCIGTEIRKSNTFRWVKTT